MDEIKSIIDVFKDLDFLFQIGIAAGFVVVGIILYMGFRR